MQKTYANSQSLVKNFIVAVVIFGYTIVTTQFSFLPPLMGLFFAYMIIEYFTKQRTLNDFSAGWYFAILFMMFSEQIHGFYLFSSIVAFLIFFHFVCDWLFSTMRWRNCLLAILVASGYIGTFLVNNLISYIKNTTLLSLSHEYIVYIVAESILAIVLFRDRVL
ncbi:hypothetical protein KDE13_04745 [Campylobacter sp. faydin G-140]|uniref:hypothetical protein n=1 Tax=Campylobacter anatolicus TaxID=2829105 RepID=UPI001BA1FC2D|nr:hypothetical protein [Campylobacter anatolicus]MBR8465666.1 hypothetical protein [Campylobacter anatolicus]